MILSVVPIAKFEVIGNSVNVVVSALNMSFMNVQRVRFVFV